MITASIAAFAALPLKVDVARSETILCDLFCVTASVRCSRCCNLCTVLVTMLLAIRDRWESKWYSRNNTGPWCFRESAVIAVQVRILDRSSFPSWADHTHGWCLCGLLPAQRRGAASDASRLRAAVSETGGCRRVGKSTVVDTLGTVRGCDRLRPGASGWCCWGGNTVILDR